VLTQGQPLDLLVVGGGINGAGIARDAAGRGLSVTLVEAQDLGGATSSASSKLIHGGLRYLEYYEFRLVRESLMEREVLLRAAPHIVWPLRFVLPHHRGLRNVAILRLGLFLYDHLGGRKRLPATRTVHLQHDPVGASLKSDYGLGFEYSDCWVEDARLVVLNAQDAQARGATIRVRTALVSATRVGPLWHATVQPEGGAPETITARAIVNAAGPWVADVLRGVGSPSANQTPRLVKGSHMVVRRLYEGGHCFTFQSGDGRVVFAIPYERDFTLIGTTDVPFTDDPRAVQASADEVAYLCATASDYFSTPVTPADVVWTYAGVRPLYDSGESSASAVTRDYVFNLEGGGAAPILLSVYGGKLTTYRKLAEHALRDLASMMPIPDAPWTRDATLPGGDIPDADFEGFLTEQKRRWPWLPADHARRLARAYGTAMEAVIGEAKGLAALGHSFGAGLSEAELSYLRAQEWARTGDDVLWRRSKLGLHLTADQRAAVSAWMKAAS
jgi:glycerol-3-phosphate dehydrogenase